VQFFFLFKGFRFSKRTTRTPKTKQNKNKNLRALKQVIRFEKKENEKKKFGVLRLQNI
jgi:hypothetical protein